MKRAIYALSFDPVTYGHIWMINQGAALFDELIVAIGINPSKTCTFSLKERLEMLKSCTLRFKNVKTTSFEGEFLVNYATSIGAEHILRGIRSTKDYEYESGIMHINSSIAPNVVTVFLIPPINISDISSSLVKSLVGSKGWENVIKKYLPAEVYSKFLKHFKNAVN